MNNRILSVLLNKLVKNKETVLSLKTGIVTYINPFAYLKIRNKLNIDGFDLITSDGVVIKILYRLFFGKNVERLSPDFSSYFSDLFHSIEDDKSTIYFIGTKPSLISKSITNIKNKYPNLNIVGYRNGYFNGNEEVDANINEVVELNPEVVVVGMGTPMQEQYLIDLKNKGWKGRGFACGGFLHQTAFKTVYYPKWVNKYNLRWLYRIYREPKLFKRYTIDYAWFLILFLIDFFKFKKR